jgi:hypothetical protein
MNQSSNLKTTVVKKDKSHPKRLALKDLRVPKDQADKVQGGALSIGDEALPQH